VWDDGGGAAIDEPARPLSLRTGPCPYREAFNGCLEFRTTGAVPTNTAREPGYGSVAIVGSFLIALVTRKVISGSDAAAILEDAVVTLKGLGNLVSVRAAVRVVGW
jgi:hypothetical protein